MKFELERVPRSPVSDKELLSDIRRVAKLVTPKAVSFRAYLKLGKYSTSTAALRFGSWNKAIVAAGFEIGRERNVADDRLFENLMRLLGASRSSAANEGAHTPAVGDFFWTV